MTPLRDDVRKMIVEAQNRVIAHNKGKTMNKEIFEYVVERRKTIGLMLGTVKAGKIKVGWCKTALKLGDKFDKDFGMDLARKRALKRVKTPKLPLCMKRGMTEFQTRCMRYFQDAKSMDLVR